jgi:glutaredoxin
MIVYVVGYEWCPHYQNVLAMCHRSHLNYHTIVVETHEQLMQKVKDLLSTFEQVGKPKETSPQIIIHSKHKAICIPGEDAFKETTFYKQFNFQISLPQSTQET